MGYEIRESMQLVGGIHTAGQERRWQKREENET